MRLKNILFLLSILNVVCYSQVSLVEAFPKISFSRPVDLQHPPDGTNRIFVVSQNGYIYSFNNDSNIASVKTFLNISDSVNRGHSEQGLLGLSFHPDYTENGFFYVYYSKINDTLSVIARYSVSPENPDSAILNSQQIILQIGQPARNHNGGQLAFGPDGYLYISLGDGGGGGDNWGTIGNGQNRETLLGNILRIDVDDISAYGNYSIPEDNPYQGNLDNFREEIFAYGFRNPWRFSFDPVTGWLWAGDVGQGLWEEIDIVEAGKNYGWRIMEGSHCYKPAACSDSGLTYPIVDYSHSYGGLAVTGGHVYRGSKVPYLYGKYIYGDYASGMIWTLEYDGINPPDNKELLNSGTTISAFGVDQNYELYMCSLDGKIYKFYQPNILDQVSLQYPENASVLTAPQQIIFKWSLVAGASQYNFHLARDNSFIDIVNTYTLKTDSLLIEGLPADTTFYWRVSASDSIFSGAWSETFSFIINDPLQLAAPQLISPEDNEIITNDTIVFKWSMVTDADNYKLEISNQDNFATIDTDSILSDTTLLLAFDAPQDQHFYWRTRALKDTTSGIWSEIRSFETGEILGLENKQSITNSFKLNQNFPNPFNPVTTINYQIAKNSTVTLTVFNIKGEQISILVDTYKPAGSYSINFNGSGLASGIYFYQLKAGPFSQIRRMLLIK